MGLFKNDIAARWISSPSERLTLGVLYRFSFLVLEKGSTMKKELSKSTLTQLQSTLEVLRNIPSNSVLSKLIHEAVSTLKALLVDTKSAAVSATMTTLFGAVKSVVNRSIDPDLIDGLKKGIMAGFDMYKHCSAEKQLSLTKLLSPASISVEYDDLVKSSKVFMSVDGNWYISLIT